MAGGERVTASEQLRRLARFLDQADMKGVDGAFVRTLASQFASAAVRRLERSGVVWSGTQWTQRDSAAS